MKYFTLLILSLALFSSCIKDKTVIVLNTDNAEGLTTETKITVNGLAIGKINELNLATDGTINLSCELDSETKIPNDSDFKVSKTPLPNIQITFGKNEEFIKSGDTLKVYSKSAERLEVLLNNGLEKLIDKIITPKE